MNESSFVIRMNGVRKLTVLLLGQNLDQSSDGWFQCGLHPAVIELREKSRLQEIIIAPPTLFVYSPAKYIFPWDSWRFSWYWYLWRTPCMTKAPWLVVSWLHFFTTPLLKVSLTTSPCRLLRRSRAWRNIFENIIWIIWMIYLRT